MLKPVYNKTIDALRNAYDQFNWLLWFFPRSIGSAIEGLPPVVREPDQLTPYEPIHAIALIDAFKRSKKLHQ